MRRRNSKKRPFPLAFVTVVAVVAMGAALLAIVSFAPSWMPVIARSACFTKIIQAQTGRALQADASIDPLAWSESSAYTPGLRLEGLPHSIIDRIEAEDVRVVWDWQALANGAWRIEEIAAPRLRASLKKTTTRPAASDTQAPVETISPLLFFIPSRFELGRIVVENCDFSYQNISAKNVRVNAKQTPWGWNIEGGGGTLSTPGFPLLAIDSFQGRSQSGVLHLDAARLQPQCGGEVSSSGQIGATTALRIEWRGVPIKALVDTSLAQYLNGEINGHAVLNSHDDATGSFEIINCDFSNIPHLAQIATMTGKQDFKNLRVTRLTGDFKYTANLLTLQNIVFESNDLLRLKGEVTIGPDGRLDGNLLCGLNPAALASLPGTRKTVFTMERDGFCWTPVRLSGSVSKPLEDLSPRITASIAGDVLINQGIKTINNAPGSAIETAKDFIDLLGPLLP
jgi:hypothetical protein